MQETTYEIMSNNFGLFKNANLIKFQKPVLELLQSNFLLRNLLQP